MSNQKVRDRVYILRMAKKIMAINYLGKKCKECGDGNIFHLTFHHKVSGEKELGICESLEKKWSHIKPELDKCILLCCNCHQERHGVESKSTIKLQLLELIGRESCSVCGYVGKNNASLSFHHKENKEFWLTEKCNYTRNELGRSKEEIIEEMEKCILVCENCHREIHADKVKFERLKNKIDDKIKNYKESTRDFKKEFSNNKTKRCDESICLSLRSNGKTIREIMEITGYCCESIQKIFSKNKLFGRMVVSKEKVIELWKSGESVHDIAKHLNCSEANIYKIMKESKEISNSKKDILREKAEKEKAVFKSYVDGNSIRNIATLFSFPKWHVSRIIRKFNLQHI